MKLQKAIEIVSEEVKHPYSAKKLARPDALKLLIEAGKQVIERRGHDPDFLFEKLPGETQDHIPRSITRLPSDKD